MSRIAEASACAGRAVPDSSRVDWAKERAAAETLLNDGTPENAARPAENAARPAPAPAAAARAVDPVEQTGVWPPKFDLDDVDLSSDNHARSFRRVSTTSRAPHVQPRTDFDDATPGADSTLRDRADVATTPAVTAQWSGFRQTALSAKRGGAEHEPIATDGRRAQLRRVIIIVALMIVLASVAVLTYVLWNRGATEQNADPSARSSTTSVVQVTGQPIS